MGDAELFVKAAKFLTKYVKDIDFARKMLFKGIRLHKREPQLYLEFFRMELEFVAKKRKEAKNGVENTANAGLISFKHKLTRVMLSDSENLCNDSVLEGKTAEVVCFSALKVIKSMDFKFDLIKICAKYDFATDLKFRIYELVEITTKASFLNSFL